MSKILVAAIEMWVGPARQCRRPYSSGLLCRDFARAFPKLDVLAVNELLGSFARRWFVDAIKFKAKLYVAVRSKNVGSILRHELLQNISSEAETREITTTSRSCPFN